MRNNVSLQRIKRYFLYFFMRIERIRDVTIQRGECVRSIVMNDRGLEPRSLGSTFALEKDLVP